MTDEQAHQVLELAEKTANGIYSALTRMTTPDVAITALGLVAGTVFASLEPDDGNTVEQMFEDWFSAVRMQYETVKESIEEEKKKAN